MYFDKGLFSFFVCFRFVGLLFSGKLSGSGLVLAEHFIGVVEGCGKGEGLFEGGYFAVD